MDYFLSCCSTTDMTEEWFTQRNVKYICSHYQINDGEMLPDDLGKSTPFPDFYQAIRDGAMTSTSQISPGEYEEYFDSLLSQGMDVIHISLSTGLTTTCQSAMLGAEPLKEKYPDRKLVIIDSLNATCGYGLLVEAAADLRDKGMEFDELCAWVTENRNNINVWACTNDLKYLIRGGRVSKLSGTIGQLLNVCPIIHIAPDGSLKTGAKIRTFKKALKHLEETMEGLTNEGTEYSGKVFIGHADNMEGAQMLSAMIEEKFKKLAEKPRINYIGTTIGSHTGPGLVAFAFLGKKREE